MTRRTYTPEHKAKLVIEVLQGEKELNTIAAENGISPNMLRNWKAEFLENASRAFDGSRQADIRFSIGRQNTENDIVTAAETLRRCLKR